MIYDVMGFDRFYMERPRALYNQARMFEPYRSLEFQPKLSRFYEYTICALMTIDRAI